MTVTSFTGERLHAGQGLFGVDLARHRAAYVFAAGMAAGRSVLELGCGSGYGTAEIAASSSFVVGVDRVTPDPSARVPSAYYVRADLNGVPIRSASFDLAVSFQVIEHLPDPNLYLRAISAALRPSGTALITTPNRLTSDGENPYHVREYVGSELAECVAPYFDDVELRGIGATPAVARYLEARLERIRRITRLDPLGLRRRLPRPLVEWLFARFALLVRRGIRRDEGLPPAAPEDFPIGPADDRCVDLLAICRHPRV